MAKISEKEKNKKWIRSIELEIDDFEERYAYGDEIHEDEWINNGMDWLNYVYLSLKIGVKNPEKVPDYINERFGKCIERVRKLKPKILEKGYHYPEVIDQIALTE
jgi:hypothetical protein